MGKNRHTEKIYARAIALLHELSSEDGIYASMNSTANYRSIFTRDAVMAGISGLLLGDAKVLESLVATLRHLRLRQGTEGQIASNYQPECHTSFGSLTPKVDAVTWYMLGVALSVKAGHLAAEDWKSSVQKCVSLLNAMEYNGKGLVYVPMGGNWADEYPYFGYVLYDQALRLWALKEAGSVFAESAWLTKAEQIESTILVNYLPEAKAAAHPQVYHKVLFERAAQHNIPYLYCSFSPGGYQKAFDLAAHVMLAMALMAPMGGFPASPGTSTASHAETRAKLAGLDGAMEWIDSQFVSTGELPPVFYPVIHEKDDAWEVLSNYHLYNFRNHPYHYHNGGVWPIWLGWLGLTFAYMGKKEALDGLVQSLTQTLAKNPQYGFEEYFDGKHFLANGTTQMAYSCTGFLLLEVAQSLVPQSPVAL